MDWFPRTFGLVLAILAVAFLVDFLRPDLDLQESPGVLEVCPECVRESGPEDCIRSSRCYVGPFNRTCPSCGSRWGNRSISFLWIPEPVSFALILLLSGILSALRMARCPACDGRVFIRPLHLSWEAGPPCLRCGGRGRVTLLNRWLSLSRPRP
jgi:hypothetical protein